MKTRYAILSLLAGMSVFLATSCSLVGLEPFSGKHTELPIISMQFSQLASGTDGSVTRAIVQGNGFLYIRTQGGPTGTKGPFYGPYPVTAQKDFTTTDIPEGVYTSIMILYSAEVLDGTKEFAYNGTNYAFSALMALPDSDFKSFAGSSSATSVSSATSNALGEFFNGKVSFGEKKSVTLEADKTTSITMTLIPVTGTGSDIDLSKTPGKLFSSSTQTKIFYRLGGVTVPSTKVVKSFTCSLTGVAGTTGTTNNLAKVDFYDTNGKLLKVTETGTDITAGKTITLDQAAASAALDTAGHFEMFMYLEYSGSIQATFSSTIADITPVTTGGNYTFAITGAGSQAGKQVEFFLYTTDDTKLATSATGAGYWGYGSFTIAADGTGSGTLLGYDGTPATMITGDYILMAFIDANGTAAGSTVLTGNADAGDYVYIQGLDSVLHLDFATSKSTTVNFSSFTNWSTGWNSYSTVSLTISSPGTFAGKNAYIRFLDTASTDVQYFTGLVGSTTTTIDCLVPNGTWKLDAFIDMDNSGISLLPNPGDWCISSRDITVSADMTVSLTGADFSSQIPIPVNIGIIMPSGAVGTRWLIDVASMVAAIGTNSTYECMYSNDTVAAELSNTQALIAKGIKVLIIAPVESANCPAATAAKAAGVTVISYDRLLTGSSNVDYYTSFDNFSVGVLQGSFLVSQAVAAGGSGYPLYLYAGNYNDNNSLVFFAGAWSVLQPKILDGTFVIKNSPVASSLMNSNTLTGTNLTAIIKDPANSIDTEWNTVTATSLASGDFSASPPGTGKVFILAPNDSTARAISDVFRGSVTNDNLVITGQDAEKISVQYIIDGKQSMTILKDIRVLGIDAAALALDVISGTPSASTGTVNNGAIDVSATLLPGVTVTKPDIQSLLIDSGFYSATDFTGL